MEQTIIQEIECAIEEYDRLYIEADVVDFLKAFFRSVSTQQLRIEGFEIEDKVLRAWNFYYLITSVYIEKGVLDKSVMNAVIEGLRDHYVQLMTNPDLPNIDEFKSNIRMQYAIHGQASIILDRNFNGVLFRTSSLLMMQIIHQFDQQSASDVADWLVKHYYRNDISPVKTKSFLVWS